jgi:hypothetical protein
MRQVIVLVSVLALVGCSMSATQYAVHPDTVATLRSHAGKSVTLTPFTSGKPGKSEIICRLVGMVQTPGGVPFEVYVGDAFRTELLVAGLTHDAAVGWSGAELPRYALGRGPNGGEGSAEEGRTPCLAPRPERSPYFKGTSARKTSRCRSQLSHSP